MSDTVPAYIVRANLDRNRYEVMVDDQVAGHVDFELSDGQVVLTHTEVRRDFRGRGLARRVVANALFDARLCQLAVVPVCPYVRRVIELMPEKYLDLVRPEDRDRFELLPQSRGGASR